MQTPLKNLQRVLLAEIANVEIVPSNNEIEGKLARDLFIAQLLKGMAKPFEKAADGIKAAYAAKLGKPCDEFELFVTTNVTVNAKVANARESFDKAEFIKQVSTKYKIASTELNSIALDCVKKSACPVTLFTTVN